MSSSSVRECVELAWSDACHKGELLGVLKVGSQEKGIKKKKHTGFKRGRGADFYSVAPEQWGPIVTELWGLEHCGIAAGGL